MADQDQLTRRELIQVTAAAAAVAAAGVQRGVGERAGAEVFLEGRVCHVGRADRTDHSHRRSLAGSARRRRWRPTLTDSSQNPFEEESKKQWHEGLKRIDALSQAMHGKRFLEATPDERVAVLSRASRRMKRTHKRRKSISSWS